jgi:hypothetical protein
MADLIGIVVGFALTTVIGGLWASRLQQRSWDRQNDVRLQEAELEQARVACQDVMSLLDRRLYRMLRLVWAVSPTDPRSITAEELEQRRQDYVAVLFEWNDRLNTNLSLIGSYFGDDARAYVDALYEDFKRVGRDLEELLRVARAQGDASTMALRAAGEFEGRESGSLNDRVYQFGLMLMGQLREGLVGRRAPNISVATVLE